MAKKKKSRRTKKSPSEDVRRRVASIIEGKPDLEKLEEFKLIAHRYPDDELVQKALLATSYDLGDKVTAMSAAEKLIELEPDDADGYYALSDIYLENQLFALSIVATRAAVERYPDHPGADLAAAKLKSFAPKLALYLEGLHLQGDDAFECAVLHEEVQARMMAGDYQLARAAAEDLLNRRPDFAAARNNLTQIDFAEGKLGDAIAQSRAVLEEAPDNAHAVAKLVRLLSLNGDLDEARLAGERFAEASFTMVDHYVAAAEAWSILGDDEQVLAIYARLLEERPEELTPARGKTTALSHHFAAVAEARLGHEDRARELWNEALEAKFGQALILANLEDLDRAPGEQNGAWALPFANWVNAKVHDGVIRILRNSMKLGHRSTEKALRLFLRDHPTLETLLPALLDRSDPDGRLFAYALARKAWTPKSIEALRQFVTTRRGPDALRLEVLELLIEKGVIADEPIMMWYEGERRLVEP